MSDQQPYDILSGDGIPVTLPSGSTFFVMTDSERAYLKDKIDRYIGDNHFVNIADISDIDKLVTFELLIHRWALWVSKGRDYFDDDINVKQYADLINDYSTECRQLKKILGVDKVARDKVRGDDSVAGLWSNLQQRAKEFGYMRNEQAAQAIESMQRIKSIITFYRNADDQERLEFHATIDDVLQVITEEIEKFDLIDENFRKSVQQYWIRNQ